MTLHQIIIENVCVCGVCEFVRSRASQTSFQLSGTLPNVYSGWDWTRVRWSTQVSHVTSRSWLLPAPKVYTWNWSWVSDPSPPVLGHVGRGHLFHAVITFEPSSVFCGRCFNLCPLPMYQHSRTLPWHTHFHPFLNIGKNPLLPPPHTLISSFSVSGLLC